MRIKDQEGNSAVTPNAKRQIRHWFKIYGCPEIREILLHEYCGGDYVCISYNEDFEDRPEVLNRYINTAAKAVRDHADNRWIEDNYGTVWVSREWVGDIS